MMLLPGILFEQLFCCYLGGTDNTLMNMESCADTDPRFAELQRWLSDDLGLPVVDISPASADASFRRYFRVTYHDVTRIVMDAPPQKEDVQPFITISALLAGLGLHVPEVLAQDKQRGFLLLTDLGSRQYLQELNNHTVQQLYDDALQALILLQSCPAAELQQIPSYDRALLQAEMALFREWYLGRLLNISLTDEQQEALEASFAFLASAALEQPRVLVHRDYHSRNLMVDEPNPGVLDFQDAVVGPVSYDLVSLLRDCYVVWPREQVVDWVGRYHQRAVRAGILRQVDGARLLRWFDLMGVQRHLKAVGIFSRLNIRDGKPGYLKDIPRTMGYLEQVCPGYPELKGLREIVSEYPFTS